MQRTKKRKLNLHQHIAANSPLHKSVYPIPRNGSCSHTGNPFPYSRRIFAHFPCYFHHHAPVEAQMEGHPYKSPIYTKHMQFSGKESHPLPASGHLSGKMQPLCPFSDRQSGQTAWLYLSCHLQEGIG